jgi:transposase
MKKERRKFSPVFKTKVVLESIKEASTSQELASKYSLHPTQITAWKREFLEKADTVFGSEKAIEKDESKEKELYSKIGELQIQVDFLKKVLGK